MTVRLSNFTPEVLLSTPRRSSAIPNPSGTLVAYTQSTYSFESHSTSYELRVLDVETRKSTILADSYRGEPQWLGDGDKLVWLKGTDSGNTNFVIGDARDASKTYTAGVVPGSVSDLKVTTLAPGKIAVVVSGKSNPDGTLFNPSDEKKPVSSGKIFTSLFVRHWDEYIQPQKAALWYGTLQKPSFYATKDAKYCLSELKNLFHFMDMPHLESPIPPFGGTDNFDICPQGIVFVAKDPQLNLATHTKCVVYYCPLSSWTEAASLQLQSVKLAGLNGALTCPVLSPVANTLAFLAMKEDGYEADKNRIIIVPRLFEGSAEPVEVFATADGSGSWDLSPSSLTWAEGDTSLFIRAEEEGTVPVFQLPLGNLSSLSTVTTDRLRKLTYSGTVTNAIPAGNKLFLSSNSLVESSSFSYLDLEASSARGPAAAHPSVSVVSGPSLGLSRKQVDEIWFEGAEGHPVHAWVVKPSSFSPDSKYPLCYLIHGGPQGAWNDSWSTRWNPAVFAEQGYVVIAPNPTGSTGYGQAFTDAIQNSWGGKPYEDIVKGFEYIKYNLPYVDTDRAVAMGASYGGYMMNWIQGHDLGRKFKALVTHDGIFSTRFMFATEELYFPMHDFKGPYWKVPQNWERWDPSKFLDNWQTPHLIIHNQLDYRLSIAEGLSAFNVLQMRGVDSMLLTFPDENHWVLKPENSLVWHRTVINWINKYVGLPALPEKHGIVPEKLESIGQLGTN